MARSRVNQASNLLYGLARGLRDFRALQRAVQTGSPAPIVESVIRRRLGRELGRAERKVGL